MAHCVQDKIVKQMSLLNKKKYKKKKKKNKKKKTPHTNL